MLRLAIGAPHSGKTIAVCVYIDDISGPDGEHLRLLDSSGKWHVPNAWASSDEASIHLSPLGARTLAEELNDAAEVVEKMMEQNAKEARNE